ncbi:MAG: hypothetical protein GXO39_04215 [Thermotogae bacterium]|nr:hypothetical protein [Thermotogota bacterium]
MKRLKVGSGVYCYVKTPEEFQLEVLTRVVKELVEESGREDLRELLSSIEAYKKKYAALLRATPSSPSTSHNLA